MERKQILQINSCFGVIFREVTMSIPSFQMRFSCDIYPARYLSTLLSQKNSNDTNPTILPSTGLSVLHLGKFYLTTVLNPSLCNLSPFSFILANNPSQIRRINYCFLFALFITCLKSIIYRFTAFKLLEV